MNIEVKLDEVRKEYLYRMTRGDNSLLREVEAHITSRDGKMLRPKLTLLAAATLGEEHLNSRRTLLSAVCVEMLHNTSLIHDDVIDRDLVRRGQPSVNARWGNGIAVLVGDWFMAQIMDLINEIDDPNISRLISRTVTEMVESELLAQEATISSQPLAVNADRYLKIIDGKTARLFATACALGNPEYENYGLHYGRIFQLRDDIDDKEETPWTQELLLQEEKVLSSLKALAINDIK